MENVVTVERYKTTAPYGYDDPEGPSTATTTRSYVISPPPMFDINLAPMTNDNGNTIVGLPSAGSQAQGSFLRLLSWETFLILQVDEFIQEIIAIIDRANKTDLYSDIYLYSIQGTSRSNVEIKTSYELNIDEATRIQLKYGYLYHDLIYSLDRADLIRVLQELVKRFNNIEISIKTSLSEFSTRKRVSVSSAQSIP